MYRENIGRMDVNITHDLSTRNTIKRDERILDYFCDLAISSKVEVRNNNIKGVQ